MVGIKTNHDKDYAENIPECFRQIDQLLNDTVKSHDSQLPNGAVKESTHVKDKQSSSGLDMNEFQLEIQRLRSDIDALHAYNRSLERDSAMIASVVPKNQKLRGKVDDLTKTLESKDAEIRMLRAVAANPTGAAAEASHTHVQMQSIKDTINDLITENRALMESIQDFKTQTGNATRIQASVSDMQTELATKEKINTQLTTKLAESADTIKHMIGLSESLRAERDTKDSQLEELQAKLDAAEEARDWHRKEHTQMLELRNTLNASRTPEIDRLKEGNQKLKEEIQVLVERLSKQLQDIGYYITDLDLAEEGLRIYKCEHDSDKKIPYDLYCTQRLVRMVVYNMYRQWGSTEEFRKGYERSRQVVLDHHRGHEKAGHVRGHRSQHIKTVLIDIDRKRGALIKYS